MNEILLARHDLRSTVIQFAGGDYMEAARKAGVADQLFAFQIEPQGAREADLVVHLPQIEL